MAATATCSSRFDAAPIRHARNRDRHALFARELRHSTATVPPDLAWLRRELPTLMAPDPMAQVQALLAEPFRQDKSAAVPDRDRGPA
jgi:hypothetical protein